MVLVIGIRVLRLVVNNHVLGLEVFEGEVEVWVCHNLKHSIQVSVAIHYFIKLLNIQRFATILLYHLQKLIKASFSVFNVSLEFLRPWNHDVVFSSFRQIERMGCANEVKLVFRLVPEHVQSLHVLGHVTHNCARSVEDDVSWEQYLFLALASVHQERHMVRNVAWRMNCF